jgi:hypothetical protein
LAPGSFAEPRRVSVSTQGEQATYDPPGLCGGYSPTGSSQAAISADGRFVTFVSDAGNLVAGDTNRRNDVFVRDLTAGTTTRVSVSSSGAQIPPRASTNQSGASDPSISADGRFVTFLATEPLVPGAPAISRNLYLHDRVTRLTELVNRRNDGSISPDPHAQTSISADGRYVAWATADAPVAPGDSDPPQNPDPTKQDDVSTDVYVRDRATGTNTLVSVGHNGGPGTGRAPVMSANGRYVAFGSQWGTLVPGDTNGCPEPARRNVSA